MAIFGFTLFTLVMLVHERDFKAAVLPPSTSGLTINICNYVLCKIKELCASLLTVPNSTLLLLE